MSNNTIRTIGHSTLEAPEFVAKLKEHNIAHVCDIRSYPGSRHCPQFGQERMQFWLADKGIGYTHIPKLGGRRNKQPNADRHLNDGWRLASFRNYADYALSGEFRDGLQLLQLQAMLGENKDTAFMCSEALPWKCHRSIVSTWLVAQGWNVDHIVWAGVIPHELGKWGPTPEIAHQGVVTFPEESK